MAVLPPCKQIRCCRSVAHVVVRSSNFTIIIMRFVGIVPTDGFTHPIGPNGFGLGGGEEGGAAQRGEVEVAECFCHYHVVCEIVGMVGSGERFMPGWPP